MLILSAIFLAAMVVAVPLFKRLGLGAVLGYLAAGVLIGPSGLGLVDQVEETLHFAEFGVVLLLFLVGLELQPSRLWKLRGAVFGLGGLQVVGTTVVMMAVLKLVGLSWSVAFTLGVAGSMSSTALVTQLLGEKNELGAPHGRAAFGILLFQDLAAIPVLAFIPLLGAGPALPSDLGRRIAIILGVLAGLVVVGRYVLRHAFRFVAQARSHEVQVASALLVVVGTALVMDAVGLSMALGSFLAGVLLADSEYRHDLEANIEPFKGLLLALFFVAVGMSANLGVALERPLTVVAAVLGLVALKAPILWLLGRRGRLTHAGSLSLAVALAQGGEFAFVIFGQALGAHVLDRASAEVAVVSVTLSMAATPILFIARDAWARRRAKVGEQRPFDEIPDEGSRVILAGFGRFGQIIGRVLRLKRIPFAALDVSATHVDFVRKFGNTIYYGDASRVDLLRAAGAARAEVFILAIDDPEASLRTLAVVQQHFPHLRVVARARNRPHAYALFAAGVTAVIRETFAGSLEAAQATLEELGLSSSEARQAVRFFGDYDERMVRETFTLRGDQKALIESSKNYTAELERLFEEDARAR